MKTWRERLADPRPLDEYDAVRAKSWETCAVGECHKRVPEVVLYCTRAGEQRVPVDYFLRDFGILFYGHVNAGDARAAEAMLDQIDDRVLELKRERGA